MIRRISVIFVLFYDLFILMVSAHGTQILRMTWISKLYRNDYKFGQKSVICSSLLFSKTWPVWKFGMLYKNKEFQEGSNKTYLTTKYESWYYAKPSI